LEVPVHPNSVIFLILAGMALPTAANTQAPTTSTPRSETRALVWSLAGTAIPIAAGIAVVAARHRNTRTGEPANEAYDVVGGALIGLGLGVGPSLGHFYSGKLGWVIPRVLVGSAALVVGASQDDWDAGAGVLLVGGAAVTILAVRDIATAPAAARSHNRRDTASVVLLPLLGGVRPKMGVGLRIAMP
jgi:hypothetical protein